MTTYCNCKLACLLESIDHFSVIFEYDKNNLLEIEINLDYIMAILFSFNTELPRSGSDSCNVKTEHCLGLVLTHKS